LPKSWLAPEKTHLCPNQFPEKSFLNPAIVQPISSFDAGTFAFEAIYDQGVFLTPSTIVAKCDCPLGQ
jgi:hypothetical protein